MTDGLTFKALKLSRWRQFADVRLEFHDKLTVITGANGSGKSTLLNVLARNVGAERPYMSVPVANKEGGLSYIVGRTGLAGIFEKIFGKPFNAAEEQVGEIEYSDGSRSPLNVPPSVGHSYGLNFPNEKPVLGVVIGSHRLMPRYQQLQHFTFRGIPPEEAFQRLQNEAYHRYIGQSSENSLLFHIKDTLANWAAIGEGNKTLRADGRQKTAYDGFITVLKTILPASLGFIDIEVRPPEVVLLTKSGQFPIDAASGGITNLIEVAALIYGFTLRADTQGKRFAVVYDEPENHLHPLLQRSLFQNLIKAFPLAQFITATHSPFVVSSLKESNVYVLRYRDVPSPEATEQSRVVAEKLDYENRAGSASEILRDVLGLESTLPQWVEESLAHIVRKYEIRDLNQAMLSEMKVDLVAAGLGELYPAALAGLARNQ